ncbi:exodeoxyribonuclease VII large subunit [Tessaracoccus flavus]|uniref:Exodeoxyribonuclease 7 large subunit n=1 Tax=Tessaracoccus flavus TaxID=1610493 RepID=A0A1Q2CGD7_9ACTN|nr:exodeoxyribonuclease VII large subunit [Tessaracoccus flavus]AQP45176.1 exodeoxyribonuclease VII large subunit [Tessaracoccus flavus]SDY54162.1 Exodeoxyribonuclease VII large subunit [Tessaracoccus flavus]
MSLTSSPEQPQPLGRVIMAVKDWVGRCGEIWVDAQIVEIKRRSGPTQFLTFRDRIADMSAQVTASSLVLDAAGPLPEGSRVTARIRPRVWERNSSLSFECLELQVEGEGKLLARLEQLKRKLQAEGLFDAHRKRRLPVVPRLIGLVTGKDSDAERDVVTNVLRRWPAANIRTRHAIVQGARSAESVMEAVAALDADAEVDVIIIARGGGSLEDLLSFSDEGLVRLVAGARTPIVTAIGHERDAPIVDLVADVRASTPTDAAKLVVPDHRQESAGVADARERLRRAVETRLTTLERQLDDLRSRPVLVDPTSAFVAHFDRLVHLRHRLNAAVESTLREQEATLRTAVGTIRALSPKRTLERGYAVLVDDRHRSVSAVDDTQIGARIHAYLADGQLALDVVEQTKKEISHD